MPHTKHLHHIVFVGIGSALAQRLGGGSGGGGGYPLPRGAALVLSGHDSGKLDALAARLGGSGSRGSGGSGGSGGAVSVAPADALNPEAVSSAKGAM